MSLAPRQPRQIVGPAGKCHQFLPSPFLAHLTEGRQSSSKEGPPQRPGLPSGWWADGLSRAHRPVGPSPRQALPQPPQSSSTIACWKRGQPLARTTPHHDSGKNTSQTSSPGGPRAPRPMLGPATPVPSPCLEAGMHPHGAGRPLCGLLWQRAFPRSPRPLVHLAAAWRHHRARWGGWRHRVI
jgi:hypothetical protein